MKKMFILREEVEINRQGKGQEVNETLSRGGGNLVFCVT